MITGEVCEVWFKICFLVSHNKFKVDRPQTTVVAKNLSVLQLFIIVTSTFQMYQSCDSMDRRF